MSSARATSPWKTALLAVAATLAALAVAEAVARLLWTAPWYERLVAAQVTSQQLEYRENSLGLRDREYGEKPPGRLRILILGDSFTFGQGVTDEAAIFPELLEQRLSASGVAPNSVDVLNGGIRASLTGDWLRLWRAVAPRFDPDILLIVFFLRDGTLTASIPRFFDEIRREVASEAERSRLYDHCFLYRYFRDRALRAEVADRYTQEFHDAYFGHAQARAEWTRAKANLRRLVRSARARSTTVGLAVFPILVELDDAYPFRAIVDEIVAFGQKQLPVHDLFPAFAGRNGPDLWVSPLDQHPNARAHAIAAESLLPFVTELIASHAAGDAGDFAAEGPREHARGDADTDAAE